MLPRIEGPDGVHARGDVRILHVISAYPPARGGAQVHAQQLARAQVRRGDEVHVATLWRTSRKDWLRGTTVRAPAPAPPGVDEDGVVVHPGGLSPGARLVSAVPAATYYGAMRPSAPALTRLHRPTAAAVIERAAPDVAHLSRIGREGFYQAFVDELERQGVPWVLTPNHHPHWTRRRDWWWLRLYRAAGAVLAFSDSEAAALRDCGVAADRLVRTVVGPTGLPVQAAPEPLPAAPRVLFLGQVRAYKGIAVLAEAIAALRSQGLPVELDVAGPWVDRLPRLRRRLEAADHVAVHGPVDEDVKARLLTRARVLCVPSTEESLGGVYLEAWASGRPAVGADVAPVRELFQRTGGGLTAAPTGAGVAAALRALLTDDARARDAAAAGHRAVDASYTWDAAADHAARAYAVAARRADP